MLKSQEDVSKHLLDGWRKIVNSALFFCCFVDRCLFICICSAFTKMHQALHACSNSSGNKDENYIALTLVL